MALLLWGLRMVRTGVQRAYGARLRRLIAAGMHRLWTAFAAGMGVTAMLQSSTATVFIAASCTEKGLVGTRAAVAVALGADLGSALLAQVLGLRVDWLPPALVLAGFLAFATGSGARRDLGRAILGLGLMLLALHLVVAASQPLRESALLPVLVHALAGEPLLALLLAALLTALAHSSLAMVLVFSSLAAAGMLEPAVAVMMVLGVNLGAGVPALVATWGASAATRRMTLGNFMLRALLALPLGLTADLWVPLLPQSAVSPAQMVLLCHLAFNLGLVALALPVLGPVARLLDRLVAERPGSPDEGRPRHLDEALIETGTVALAAAAREALRMGDMVERMLEGTMKAIAGDDRRLAEEVSRLDDEVDRLHEAIKLYLARVSREALSDEEARRCFDIVAFTTNLEHVGDIIDKNLIELAQKKMKKQLAFSAEGMAEIRALHDRVLATLKQSLAVFISGDIKIARALLSEKTQFRDEERRAAERHLERLKAGRPESIETSALHLDILRDLKRIHSHLIAVAYPILEAAGELADSRLRARQQAAAGA